MFCTLLKSIVPSLSFMLPLSSLFHHLGPLVIESPCPSVCLPVCVCHRETPTSGGRNKFWSKGVLLILACNDPFFFFLSVLMIFCVFKLFWVFGATLLWISLLWIMED